MPTLGHFRRHDTIEPQGRGEGGSLTPTQCELCLAQLKHKGSTKSPIWLVWTFCVSYVEAVLNNYRHVRSSKLGT